MKDVFRYVDFVYCFWILEMQGESVFGCVELGASELIWGALIVLVAFADRKKLF